MGGIVDVFPIFKIFLSLKSWALFIFRPFKIITFDFATSQIFLADSEALSCENMDKFDGNRDHFVKVNACDMLVLFLYRFYFFDTSLIWRPCIKKLVLFHNTTTNNTSLYCSCIILVLYNLPKPSNISYYYLLLLLPPSWSSDIIKRKKKI